MNRVTGVLIIEVVNSNPNGNPDQESDPRLRPDNRGMISPVSFKRKLRDLVEDKEGPVWSSVGAGELALNAEQFFVLESRGRDRKLIEAEAKDGTFQAKYWDARIFGNTFLEKEGGSAIKTGTVQFGVGVSLSPVEIERLTTTNKAGVEEDKDRGMAPLAFRVVLHGVYVMPYFVNPTAARKSGCTQQDINLMKRLIPHAYRHTASYVRPSVNIRHAWHIEHTDPLGSCPDFSLIEAMSPRRKNPADSERPSSSWDDYAVPQLLPDNLRARVGSIEDLINPTTDGAAGS
ncbi:MAG TPA: CRISPR-associated protein [Solibacterales bacterium]|nr:CRISPR-associated protein [Bryobacterales bacterium]